MKTFFNVEDLGDLKAASRRGTGSESKPFRLSGVGQEQNLADDILQ